ncbi:protease modulator HflC [Parvularcula dongshanensis]|uniref:Protein HflC n=1 Tax=Parvularcula dongshanensis TaxID=1173995 RepID=A0A840I314_9PROT|nr:protease modulator HflC [Parvularcula dongshanensis]MBB4659157.1 membrane protease subunit HflC [Parvularcula dongshanensis]
MTPKRVLLIVLGFIALFVLSSVLFTVREDQQAIVLQFGDPVRVLTDDETGLHAKVPLAQNVIFLDSRNLEFDLRNPIELIVANEERLLVDAFVRYIITDPLQYFQRFSQGGRDPESMRDSFNNRLTNVLGEAMREVAGGKQISQIIDSERVEVMSAIQQSVAAEAEALGVQIVDVRIRQADFPAENAQNVYERMKSDYDQQAQRIRADGDRRAQEIRAQADKQVVTILAEAEEEAQSIRGEADGQRNAIFAQAYNRDPEFFAFYRSLNAYQRSLRSGDTVVLSPDSEFFRYFEQDGGRPAER